MRRVARFVPNNKDAKFSTIEGRVSFCEVRSTPVMRFDMWVIESRTTLKLSALEHPYQELKPKFFIQDQGLFLPNYAYAYVHVRDSPNLMNSNYLSVAGIQIAPMLGYETQITFRYVDHQHGHFEEAK